VFKDFFPNQLTSIVSLCT